jgi:G:T-mismatch repair DNA endonuclease (very short patch repair protein)
VLASGKCYDPVISIVFSKIMVDIFVEGDFWHEENLSAPRLSQMSDYWRDKINRNINE